MTSLKLKLRNRNKELEEADTGLVLVSMQSPVASWMHILCDLIQESSLNIISPLGNSQNTLSSQAMVLQSRDSSIDDFASRIIQKQH